MASWVTSAEVIESGCCSQLAVDPSTSVNRKVTVPDGRSPTPEVSLMAPKARSAGRPVDRAVLLTK
jgi:hypothetical protein